MLICLQPYWLYSFEWSCNNWIARIIRGNWRYCGWRRRKRCKIIDDVKSGGYKITKGMAQDRKNWRCQFCLKLTEHIMIFHVKGNVTCEYAHEDNDEKTCLMLTLGGLSWMFANIHLSRAYVERITLSFNITNYFHNANKII